MNDARPDDSRGGQGMAADALGRSAGGHAFDGRDRLPSSDDDGAIVGVVIRDPGKWYLKGNPPTLEATDTDGSPGSGATFKLVIAEIDGANDAVLARVVSAASAFFYQKTSRNVLISDSVTETRNGHFGQRYIQTYESPITAVTSLTLDGRAATVSPGPLQPGYGFNADGVFLRYLCFTDGFSNIVIVYTAGYAPGSPELAMIEQAVIVLAGTWFKRRLHVDENTRAQAASGSITVSFSQKDIPPETQTVINKFSRPPLFGT